MNLIRKNFMTPSSKEELFFPIEQYFEQFYQDFFKELNFDKLRMSSGYPKMDIYSEDNSFCIKMALPGMKAEDIKLEINNKNENYILQISGKMSDEHQSSNPNYFIKELKKSIFSRQISLPTGILNAEEPETSLADGILTLKWEKQKNEPQKISKIIKINES